MSEISLRGRVVFRELETGVWVLEAEDGRVFLLEGGDRKLKRDGGRIEAKGHIDSSALTVAMVGPVFRVQSYRFL